jgi:hypothetical protein
MDEERGAKDAGGKKNWLAQRPQRRMGRGASSKGESIKKAISPFALYQLAISLGIHPIYPLHSHPISV